ncbi:MAG: endonuclease III [Armatimonadetes bacterium]|nr:endonuclease III [Armatimonadota bacterium]
MPRESVKAKKARVAEIVRRLHEMYPDATCALHWKTPWELLAATILSAQCTDEKVNEVTASLFRKYRGPKAFAAANPAELEQDIRPTGFFRNKTRSLMGAAQAVVERFGGQVPRTMEEMLTLPGVQRKTANVVLGTAYGVASGITVDTHVSRNAVRMGLTPSQATKAVNTDKIEQDLMALVPQDEWIFFGHAMILHGRRVCTARKAMCEECRLLDVCPRIGVD